MPGTDEIRAQALEVAAGWSPPDAPDAPDAPDSWRLTAALFQAIAATARGPSTAAPSEAVCWRSPTRPASGSNGSTPCLPGGRGY